MGKWKIQVGPGDEIHIGLDHQHISRMTHREARELIAHLLVFGGKELRDDIHRWLVGGKIDDVANFISAEPPVKTGIDGVS